jgi:hypothetical protein
VNVPPLEPSLNVTVAVGVDFVPVDVSATVAVYVIVLLKGEIDGFGPMVVLVVRPLTTNNDMPRLVWCVLSPPYDSVIVTKPAVDGGLYTAVHEPADRVQ